MNRAALWLVIFLLLTALDFIWAKYNQATVDRKPWAASGYAVLIYALSAAGVLGYTNDPMLLLPACAGCFVGTFIATRKPKASQP